jgi:hypothetical protein
VARQSSSGRLRLAFGWWNGFARDCDKLSWIVAQSRERWCLPSFLATPPDFARS